MKYSLFQIIILLLIISSANCQILDFSNKKPKIIPIAYDSSYYALPEYGNLEEFEGLKDQRLVDSDGNIWILRDYTLDHGMYLSELKLMNLDNQKSKIIEEDEYKDYYLEAGFEKFKNRLLGIKVYPYISQNTLFVAYNDKEILIEPSQEYEITDVKYAKFKLEEYAPILEINHKGYYKLLRSSNGSLHLKGNATHNKIEFTFNNQKPDRQTIISNNISNGSGTGDYDDSGHGIFGRKIVKRNWRELFVGANQSKAKGKIAVMICVDRKGNVKYTEILYDETTETDSKRLKQAMKAAKGYKFQEEPSAPPEQCGKLIFNLDVNAFRD